MSIRRIPTSKRQILIGIVGGVTILGATAIIAMLLSERPAAIDSGRTRTYPELFVGSPECAGSSDPFRRAIRSEEEALLRADRYPYDPQDGVRAIFAFHLAASCYEATQRNADAERVSAAAEELSLRVSTDYAAARLGLSNAIEAEHWNDVLRVAQHLRRMTSHLKGDEYVGWLQETTGKATARQHGKR